MAQFICPVCGGVLKNNEKSYFCENNHYYDIAKEKYVNLLMSQKLKEKRHGDDKRMVEARKNFLGKGYYSVLLTAILSVMEKVVKSGDVVIDLGCGEGWYTDNICKWAEKRNYSLQMFGIDISKTAISYTAKRKGDIELAVASNTYIPLGNESCDICLAIFAPYEIYEIARILRKGGFFIKIYPLENHLMLLKQIIYDNTYNNKVKREIPKGFELITREEIKDKIVLGSKEDIENLFMMTPYYYKTSRADQQKISNQTNLITEIEFGIDVYKKLQS